MGVVGVSIYLMIIFIIIRFFSDEKEEDFLE